jgi:tetratricopeptide (TPR) repeat protein
MPSRSPLRAAAPWLGAIILVAILYAIGSAWQAYSAKRTAKLREADREIVADFRSVRTAILRSAKNRDDSEIDVKAIAQMAARGGTTASGELLDAPTLSALLTRFRDETPNKSGASAFDKAQALYLSRHYPESAAAAEAAADAGLESAKSGVPGAPDPMTVAALFRLAGDALSAAGDFANAIAPYRKAADIHSNAKDDPGAYVTARIDLAATLLETQQSPEGVQLFHEILPIAEKLYGAESQQVLVIISRIADANEGAAALPYLRRALAIEEKLHGKNSLGAADRLTAIAANLVASGDRSEAEMPLRRALSIHGALVGENGTPTALDLRLLADILTAAGKPRDAEPLYRRAIAILEKNLGAESAELVPALTHLADILPRPASKKEIDKLYQRALAIGEKHPGPDSTGLLEILDHLATFRRENDKVLEAEILHRRIIAITEKHFGPASPEAGAAVHRLAQLFAAIHRPDDAAPLFRRSISILGKTTRPAQPGLPSAEQVIEDYRQFLRASGTDDLEITRLIRSAQEGGGAQ